MYRKPDGHATALTWLRVKLQASSQRPGTSLDVRNSHPPGGFILGSQSSAVVLDGHHSLPVRTLQLGHDGPAAGVSRGIVNAFFEDQENLPPGLQTKLRGLSDFRPAQFEIDSLRGEQIESELAHAPDQRFHAVRLG